MKEVELELSSPDIVSKAQRVAELSEGIHLAELQFKEKHSIHRGKVKEMEADMERELACIRSRKETRNLQVELRENFEANTIEYWHEGRIVASRAMEASDRQAEMDLHAFHQNFAGGAADDPTAAFNEEVPIDAEFQEEKPAGINLALIPSEGSRV